MSCSSAIYTVNTSAETVNIGSIIPLGSTVRRYGCDVAQVGDGILVGGKGYYDVTVDATIAPTAAGNVGIQILADGAPVPGGVGKVTGVASTVVTIPAHAIYRMTCCEKPTNIQVSLVGDAAVESAVVSNLSVTVVKI